MKWYVVIVLINICAVKCAGISKSELEDFADFLDKSSKLDVILKKGSPENDQDDDNTISDHAWEDSGKFEGDLILNDRQRKLIVENLVEGLSRNGLRDGTKRWPGNEVIYYIQREHFSEEQVQAIEDGIADLAQASCVKFRPYQKGDRDAVVIQGSRRGCFSQVGYQSGYQVLNLSGRHPVGRGCFRHGTVIHELLHTLGFYHMQSSPDRDDYVDVLWENIVQPARHNFRKYNTFSVTDFGVGYDYDSVLHYSRRAFSANGRDTLVPKQSGASIGQRSGLSDKDAKKLNKMYCDADSDALAADEDSKQKPKKKPKQKPFEGHGIGYHQGKVVAIKVNPTHKTFKITSNVPKIHVIENFSQAPQALPPTQNQGHGEEIKYTYNPPAYDFAAYKKAIKSLSFDNTNFTDVDPKTYVNNYLDKPIIMVAGSNYGKTNDGIVKSNTKEAVKITEKKKPMQENNNHTKSSDVDEELEKAFDRLGKILKTHVYPSQTPDLEAYKNKEFSNEFKVETDVVKDGKSSRLEPFFVEKHEINSDDKRPSLKKKNHKKVEIDIDHTNSNDILRSSNIHKEEHSPQEEDINEYRYPIYGKYANPTFYEYSSEEIQPPYKSVFSFTDSGENKKLYEGLKEVGDTTLKDREELRQAEPSSDEKEVSYGTSYPLNKLTKVREEELDTPGYVKANENNNYSRFFDFPDDDYDNDDDSTHGKYKFIDHSPFNDNWYSVEDKEEVNDKYNKASYTLPISGKDEMNLPLKHLLADNKAIQIHGKLPSGKQSYHLFGVLVPVTQDWYKVHYDPHKSAYSILKRKSNKDKT